MTDETKATERPWEVLENTSVIYGVNDPDRYRGFRVAIANCGDELAARGGLKYGEERDANADLICRAVNSHDALVEALEKIINAPPDQFSGAAQYRKWCELVAKPALALALARKGEK